MPNLKLSNNTLQEMFQEGNLIARALHTDDLTVAGSKVGHNFEGFENEMLFLNSQRKDGVLNEKGKERKNVDRDGQRNRSATLLVPDVNMQLFADIGLLYDADKSTIRAYMYHDSVTTSQMLNKDNFFNINVDKLKFEPILSKKDFLEKYKTYRQNTDNTNKEHVKYNEVLGNFFPESVAGLVAGSPNNENKLRLLEAKQLLSEKYDLDLPMIIMDRGKIVTWNPDLNEISHLINSSKKRIMSLSVKAQDKTPEELLENYIKRLGFEAKVLNFSQNITAADLKIHGKNDFSSKEVIDFIHKISNIPQGGKYTYGINGRLKEVVNNRLVNEGLMPVAQLDGVILRRDDIKGLIEMLDKEISINDKSHKKISKKELETFTTSITEKIKQSRTASLDGSDIESIRNISSVHITGSKFNKVKEFFNKIAAVFDDKLITNKIMPRKTSVTRSL